MMAEPKRRGRQRAPEPVPVSDWITATYHCSGCNKDLQRDVKRATKTRKSFCEKTGRTVMLKLVKA